MSPAAAARLGACGVEVLESIGQHRLLSTSQVYKLHTPDASIRWTRYLLARLRANGLAAAMARPDGMLRAAVLVGSGDLTSGLRELPNGTLSYENLPAVDHSDTDELPHAVEPFCRPLSALDELAASVRAAAITHVSGTSSSMTGSSCPTSSPTG